MPFKEVSTTECRNCGMPKPDEQQTCILCDRCNAFAMSSQDNPLNLSCMILKGDYSDELLNKVKQLPANMLYIMAQAGIQFVVLAPHETLVGATDLQEKHPLLEIIGALTGGKPCPGCGKNHVEMPQATEDTWLWWSGVTRFAHALHESNCPGGVYQQLRGFVTTYYERCAPSAILRLGKSGHDLHEMRSHVILESWDDKHDHDNGPEFDAALNEKVKPFIISTAAVVGDEGEFLAEAKLAQLGLNPDCSPEHLHRVFPDAENIFTMEAVLQKEVLKQIVPNDQVRERQKAARGDGDQGPRVKVIAL